MKLLCLRIENLQSIQGKWEIRFDVPPLSESGLFAITGPTGSGKSTLLDAISLALYNEIPRIGKISKESVQKTNALITHGERNAMAEVEYETETGTYRSKWTIAYNRNNNLNDYNMEVASLPDGTILSSKKGDVPEINTKNIGLSYDQFNKAILLSQGEFARFLKEKRNEQIELLEQLSGTQNYRVIGAAVYAEYSEKKKTIEHLEAVADGMQLMTEEERTYRHEIIQEKENQLKELKPRADFLRQASEVRKALSKENQILSARITALEQLDANNTFISEKKQQLQIHEKAMPFRERILWIQNKTLLLQELERQKSTLLNEHQGLEQEESTLLDNIRELAPETLSLSDSEKKLDELLEKATILEQSIQQLTSEINRINEQIRKSYFSLTNEKLLLEKFKKEKASVVLNEELKSIKKEKQSFDHPFPGDLIECENRKNQLINEIILAEKTVALEASITVEKIQLEKTDAELIIATDEIERLLLETKNQKGIIEVLTRSVHNLNEKIQIERDKSQLEGFRHLLIPGEPCPLCGSSHHNEYSHSSKLEQLQKELAEELKKQKSHESTLAVASTTLKSKEELIRLLNQQKDRLQENIALTSNHLKSLFNQLSPEHLTDKITPQQILENLLKESKSIERWVQLVKNEQVLTELRVLASEKESLGERINTDEKSLAEISKGKNLKESIAQWKKQIHILSGKKPQLEKQLNNCRFELEKEAKSFSEEETLLLRDLANNNIENIAACESMLLRDDEEKAHRELIRIHEEKRISLLSGIDENKRRIKELESQNNASISEDELEHQLSICLSLIDQANEQRTKAKTELDNDEKNRSNHNQQLLKISALKKEFRVWQTLQQLIGDSSGKKLSGIVQEITLGRLLHFANERLSKLSPRYRLVKPEERGNELKVEDAYLGNSLRDVRTLSGGETFMLSLALALGLSDLASKNVRLDSLFIDEGFGTLDQDTLELAITTLEKLQSEDGKTIGIISHVEALKERINTQIQIKRSGKGRSTIEIVG